MSFENIVLGGASVKAIFELGALHYYDEHQLIDFDKVTSYSGASSGSVICLLLICGYRPMQLFQKACLLSSFLGEPTTQHLFGIIKNFGMLSISSVMSPIKDLVLERFGYIPTLKQLRELTGKKFIIKASNLSKSRGEDFSADTEPNMSCILAVSISCNLVPFFQQIEYNGYKYADGGFADNFPIEKSDKKTLCVVVKNSHKDYNLESFFDYILCVSCFSVNSHVEEKIKKYSSTENVTIICGSVPGVSPLNFLIDEKTKKKMFFMGYEAARIENSKERICVRGWPVYFEIQVPELATSSGPSEYSVSPSGYAVSPSEWDTQWEWEAWEYHESYTSSK